MRGLKKAKNSKRKLAETQYPMRSRIQNS